MWAGARRRAATSRLWWVDPGLGEPEGCLGGQREVRHVKDVLGGSQLALEGQRTPWWAGGPRRRQT